MHNYVLSTRTTGLKNLHRSYHVGKAASVNTAIGRVLRHHAPLAGKKVVKNELRSEERAATSRSRDSGFAGRRDHFSQPRRSFNGFDDTRAGTHSSFHRTSDNFSGPSRENYPPSLKQSSKFNDRPRPSRGETHSAHFSKGPDRSSYKDQKAPFIRTSSGQERTASESLDYPSLSSRERPFRPRTSGGSPNTSGHQTLANTHQDRNFGRSLVNKYRSGRDLGEGQSRSLRLKDASSERKTQSFSREPVNSSSHARGPPDRARLPHAADKSPVVIPYTTPASEFLYGTSVVEAALMSRRIPRRKLYKLYIYNGENREGGERDTQLERLAKKHGVEVVRVGNEGLRLMEKLSSGRPHNGYILEASPLPRLPVQSLGELATREGRNGFLATLGHQSREEAAVNGVSDFQLTNPSSGKMPLVLLLDGIVDPGNMGGILRTASFLGVSAVAISTRNSAPFSPIVLKASAGASENVTLFSVSTPAGFIVDSQNAGWKIFAGVAPLNNKDATTPRSVSTDELGDPLSESPCILMLGSEGEGLRWNLRSKADVDLYIQGCGQSHNVDSLNVSVAAGILCSAFLKTNSNAEVALLATKYSEVEEVPRATMF
ncbi:uncharacterized protein LY89DRAFT_89013 [Mollisia scopiformis]|uniref:rRNA methyltransferase 1, mitochondrial n=1 Tax=Mollisia scopiformis TaxID=149040 RepID=A0A194X5Y4_MOLSC|nr:uncharacterized protein LY89DRAFT_89013 [Mollisia scopiformis]KUJ15593.1 hypothetical protein LY89DRAFT_89013 [Mollisia scopiformis]